MIPLPDQPARDRIAADLDATIFVEAGAGSGKTKSLVDRVVALVGAGTQMRNVAAITFTEKAAAELRDRIRQAFERSRDQAALDQVDGAAICTLHAFAQRVLTEHPVEAGLPPDVQVLDEVASELSFDDRWMRFRESLLDDPDLERCLLLGFAAGIRLEDLRRLALVFNDNWDLVAEPQRFPWEPAQPPGLDVDAFVARLDAVVARAGECDDQSDSLACYLADEIAPYAERLREAPDEYEALALLRLDKPSFKAGNKGRADKWRTAKAEILRELHALAEWRAAQADAVGLACVRRIALELAAFTLEAAEQRRASGRLEFHDLLVLARQLLRGEHGVDVRRRLRARYQRLLLDEFQDTDPIQIDLAVLLASADPAAAGKRWEDVPVDPGALFFVGDPKQSIYRFRRADIDLFLRASRAFGNPPVALTTNFRATPGLVGWVNHVFGRLIAAEPGSQPAYQPLDAAPGRTDPPGSAPVVVLGSAPHADSPNADALREREAADVADAVLAARGWQVSRREADGSWVWEQARLGDIAVLLPARTSLPALEQALEVRDIPYRAETSSLVYSTREVRDLFAVARALADPSDQLALVTALRSPVFGCGDDDLFTYKVLHRGAWHTAVDPPADMPADHPVVAALRYLRALHAQLAWLTPSEVLDRVARDRRLFELGYAQGRPRDLWRRLRFVIDQARAWSEAEGGTLREYLEWARLQASESARVAETILPETDDDSVRILTIHAAKGLEFPIAIVSGMTTASRAANARVEVAFPPGEAVAIKVGKGLVTPEFEAFKPIDEQMDFHERLRLLYVACTRAQDHLVVSLHRKARSLPDEQRKWTSAELVADACAEAAAQVPLEARAALRVVPATAPPVAAPLPPLSAWEAERAGALSDSGRRRSVGASDVEAANLWDDETAAGAAKQPRDLELPPWRKGRYGSAIGRAVHAVLQTIDLATGTGIEEAAAAQAAAEGVPGREADIAHLARVALDAASVRESVALPRWRETYVATTVGDRTLEGYLDLLYRTQAGLVVVDYKTASSTADLDSRMDAYRWQGGAYALAVEAATGEPVIRVVFVFLTAAGAVERDLPDLAGAKEAVRVALSGV